MDEVYEKPTVEVVEFELDESIATSSNGVMGEEWFPG